MGTGNGEGSRNGSIAYAVVRAVTDADDRDVTELPPLYDTVDPDALETIAGTDGVRVEFRYCGYDVVVDGDGVTLENVDRVAGSTEGTVGSAEPGVGNASDDSDPVVGE